MKLAALFIALGTAGAFAQASAYTNFVRQKQQSSAVIWDMPVAAVGKGSSALLLETGGSLFQLWTVQQNSAQDYLLDQKLVGAYLPKADVVIKTLDPYTAVKRTRVDQPFTVEIQVSDLLSGAGMPLASTKVLMEQHISPYTNGVYSLLPATVAGNTPTSSVYISQNGKTTIKYDASSLKTADPKDSTKAMGEEHFIVHALSDGSFSQSQIASAKVQVWPVAYGSITGLVKNKEYRNQLPNVILSLNDVYPRSDTFFMLYEGSTVNGVGTVVRPYIWDSNIINSVIIDTDELNDKITKNGTYTVALVSQTVYGTEYLADPITFSVRRSLEVNAMQVQITGN